MEAVRAIVAEEFAARVSAVHAARVAPTVVALRAKAAQVVDAELARLAGRLAADHRTIGEVERAMRRVVDKLLHAPTVRVKELAGLPGRRRLRGRAAGPVRSRPGRGRRGHPGRHRGARPRPRL